MTLGVYQRVITIGISDFVLSVITVITDRPINLLSLTECVNIYLIDINMELWKVVLTQLY